MPDRAIELPDKPWRNLALIVGLFALVGPWIAALTGVLLLIVFAMIGSDATFGVALGTFVTGVSWRALLTFHGPPYWGILPGLAAGLIVGWYEGWRGPVTLFSAFLLGAAVGAVFYMISEFAGWQSAVYGASFGAAVTIPASVALTGLLRLFSKRPPTARTAP